MPELPEVEHAMQQLRTAAVGKTIARVHVFHPALLRSLPETAQARMKGRTITSVNRRAKLQLVTLDDGQLLEVHFRMTGDWHFGKATDAQEDRERGRIDFTDGSRVSLIDGRAFAVMRLFEKDTYELPPLGLEPLDERFDGAALKKALEKRSIPIKQALLDQKVVSGLGNIYTSEALWEAKLDPQLPANELSLARCKTLAKSIRAVLDRAPAGRYYYDGSGEAAEALDVAWRVYGREGKPCPRCKRAIERLGQGGRSTYYCSHCQH